MSTTSPRLLTAEEFARLPDLPDGSQQELVRGKVVMAPPPGFRHGRVQVQVASKLNDYAVSTKRGRVAVETGVVTERGPDTVRGPDISYWSAERLPFDQDPEGYPDAAPDLCVEVLSPSNRRSEMRDKVAEYFGRDVRMVWVVDPEDRTIAVYRSPGEARLLHADENAVIDGEDVLPGFRWPVADLFA